MQIDHREESFGGHGSDLVQVQLACAFDGGLLGFRRMKGPFQSSSLLAAAAPHGRHSTG